VQTSETGLTLIKRSEGLCLSAYRDVAGHLTIGWGHLVGPEDEVGLAVAPITEAEAEVLLARDVARAEAAVNQLVTWPLTQGQFDALVDFTFNLGAGVLLGSTLRRLVNAGDLVGARDQFAGWCHAHVNGRLVQVAGLVARRAAEVALWDGPDTDPSGSSARA
jgi:lysozyme